MLDVLDTTFQLRARSGVHYYCYVYSFEFCISVSLILVTTKLKTRVKPMARKSVNIWHSSNHPCIFPPL